LQRNPTCPIKKPISLGFSLAD